MSPKLDFSKYWEKEDYPTNPSSSRPNCSAKPLKEELKLLEELVF